MINRRTFLSTATASAALAALGIPVEALATNRIKLGNAAPFSFEALIAQVRVSAQSPYQPQNKPPAAILDKIDYEAHGKIKFNTDAALFANGPGKFPVTFFHLGRFFQIGKQATRCHSRQDRLRSPWQDQVQYRCGLVRQWPRQVSGHFFPSRAFLSGASAYVCAGRRWQQCARARDSV